MLHDLEDLEPLEPAPVPCALSWGGLLAYLDTSRAVCEARAIMLAAAHGEAFEVVEVPAPEGIAPDFGPVPALPPMAWTAALAVSPLTTRRTRRTGTAVQERAFEVIRVTVTEFGMDFELLAAILGNAICPNFKRPSDRTSRGRELIESATLLNWVYIRRGVVHLIT